MTLNFIEIYPKIVVYKDMFKDIDKTYLTLNESIDNKPDRLFSAWTQWSSFGKYLNPVSHDVKWDQKNISVELNKDNYDKQQENFVLELMQNFKLISQHYSTKYGLDIYSDGWEWTPPVICKYDHITDEDRQMTMKYHSDYIWEPIISPGSKFAITALAYFNDDYDGGEIDFAIGNNLIKYKPVTGDFLVFPSGHPEILTDNGNVYLHGVMPVRTGGNKIFSRMFWKNNHSGSEEWHEKEKQYGKDAWDKMQDEILKEFRKDHRQRSKIDGGIRLA